MEARDSENEPRPVRPGAIQAFIRKLKLKGSHTALIPVFLLAVSLVLWLAARPIMKHIGARTYVAAMVANADGEDTRASKLFKKACGEGDKLACQAFNCLNPDDNLLGSDARAIFPGAPVTNCAVWTR